MKSRKPAGFTLIEVIVGMAAATILGVGTFYLLNTTMLLWSKNFSFNVTGNSLHRSIDRLEQYLQQADTMPTLIDDMGSAVASGSAEGVTFDYFVSSSYVVTVSSSGLPASTSSLTMTFYAGDANSASQQIPVKGDVVRIDGTDPALRPVVNNNPTASGSTPGNLVVTVNLQSSLGTAVPETNVATGVTAKVVRPMAIVVKQNGAVWELRLVRPYQTTADLNDATKYVVLSRQIGMLAADQTPFSITTNNTKSFVSCSLRLRADAYDQVLANKQKDGFATFARADLSIRPKSNP